MAGVSLNIDMLEMLVGEYVRNKEDEEGLFIKDLLALVSFGNAEIGDRMRMTPRP